MMLWLQLSTIFITISLIYGFTDNIDAAELQKMKAAIPAEVFSSVEKITEEDKMKVYELAQKEDFLSSILIENERLTDLATSIIKAFGNKIAQLDPPSKQFVVETLTSLRKLHTRAVLGKDLKMEELAAKEENRFRRLSDKNRESLTKAFPVLTDMGIFTNKKLQFIFNELSKTAKLRNARKEGEL